jgi:hypothetical protein
MRCPYCNTKNQMNPSRFRGWDLAVVVLLHRPYRCRVCQYRFYRLFRIRDIVAPAKRGRPDTWQDLEQSTRKNSAGAKG